MKDYITDCRRKENSRLVGVIVESVKLGRYIQERYAPFLISSGEQGVSDSFMAEILSLKDDYLADFSREIVIKGAGYAFRGYSRPEGQRFILSNLIGA